MASWDHDDLKSKPLTVEEASCEGTDPLYDPDPIKGVHDPALTEAFKTADGGGKKNDSGKSWRPELIAPEIIVALGTILRFGADKYEARNWERGMSWGRVFGAMMRHGWAWWGAKLSGKSSNTTLNFLFGDLDTDTGYSHLWHMACCLMFLVAYEARGVGEDDRWG